MSIHNTNHFANIKQNIHTQTSNINFQRVRPVNITPVKRAHKARTWWYCQLFHLISRHQIKEGKKWNGQTQYKFFKMLYKCIMANTSALQQQAAHITYQLSSPGCSTRTIQKNTILNDKYLSFLGKKSGEWTISTKMTRQKEQED